MTTMTMPDTKKTLILYSTVDGHTQHICQYIADKLSATDNRHIQLQALPDFVEADIGSDFDSKFADVDSVIIGASIRYGKHRPAVHEFVTKYKETFAQKNIKTAFFSVNLVARKPDKNTVDTNSYVQKFLAETEWQPDVADVFAGKLDYSIYGLFDKLMIKLIMKITKGATSSDKPIVYTDWGRVDEFVGRVFGF